MTMAATSQSRVQHVDIHMLCGKALTGLNITKS